MVKILQNNYITTGEHIYFQVKGTESINIGKYKVYERKNVEKELKQEKLYKEIDVVKFSIETSLLATVERMSVSDFMRCHKIAHIS